MGPVGTLVFLSDARLAILSVSFWWRYGRRRFIRIVQAVEHPILRRAS